MKKLFYLLGTLLLTAALAACSSDYDEPEQPNSHQDEVPAFQQSAERRRGDDAGASYPVRRGAGRKGARQDRGADSGLRG